MWNSAFVFLFTGVAEHPLLPDLDIFNLSKSKDNSMETNTGEMAATETAVVDDNAPLFYSPGKRGNYFSFKVQLRPLKRFLKPEVRCMDLGSIAHIL